MSYSMTFQCPGTGQDVRASYAFGKVHLKPAYSSVHYDEDVVEEEVTEKTEEWCEEHTKKKCSSVEEAADYLESLGVHEAWRITERG